MNNEHHKSYIDARRREHLNSSHRTSTSKDSIKFDTYLTDGLDFKTRRYIDDLRQRNTMLETAMRKLKHSVSCYRSTPLDLAKMLGGDSNGELEMPMMPTPSSAMSHQVLEAIRMLTIELPKKMSEVELFKGKTLRLRTGEWLVVPPEYAALVALISDSENKN